MGYKNVQTVYVLHRHLKGASFRLLAYMALRTHDNANGDELTYTGTREDMALAIGAHLPDEPAADDTSERAEADRAARKAALQAVSNALRPLYKEGIVTRPGNVRVAETADYKLRLWHIIDGPEPVDNSVEQGRI